MGVLGPTRACTFIVAPWASEHTRKARSQAPRTSVYRRAFTASTNTAQSVQDRAAAKRSNASRPGPKVAESKLYPREPALCRASTATLANTTRSQPCTKHSKARMLVPSREHDDVSKQTGLSKGSKRVVELLSMCPQRNIPASK